MPHHCPSNDEGGIQMPLILPVVSFRHWWGIGGAFIICLAAGCNKGDAKKPEKEKPPVPIRTAKAEKRVLRPKFEVIGTVLADPERIATLTAATPGLVDKLT